MADPQTLPEGRVDLHTHSRCSDGSLTPGELVAAAAARQVGLLALTDHDTLAGLAEAQAACERQGIRFVPGVELSCRWRDSEIHVLGLAIDPTSAALQALCAAQHRRRCTRVAAMGERLSALGLPGAALSERALCAGVPTRAHLAEALHALGLAASAQQGFERYLAAGRDAYVACDWPALTSIVSLVVHAGGLPVLAHPHRYGLGMRPLSELAAEFRQAGGAGVETSVAGMGPADAAQAARLARRFGLAGSMGSDFHQPGIPWRPLGRLVKLPEAVTSITARLAEAHGLGSGASRGGAADR